MTLVFALCMVILAIINRRIGRSIAYPPTLFCSVWATILLALALVGERFNTLAPETLGIYLGGAMTFSFGGASVLRNQRRKPSKQARQSPGLCAPGFVRFQLALLIFFFPLYTLRLRELGAVGMYRQFWQNVRAAGDVYQQKESFGPYLYLITLSTLLALSLWADFLKKERSRRSRTLTIGAFMLALLYNLSLAARLGSVILVLSASLIYLIMRKAPTLKALTVTSLTVLVIFVPASIVLGKGGSTTATLEENIRGVSDSLLTYVAGGAVAFDGVVRGAISPAEKWRTLRFGYIIANSLGVQAQTPILVSEFTNVPRSTNVYSVYLPYFVDYGLGGLVLILFLVGALATWLFQRAREGDLRFIMWYAILGAYLLLSAADEYLFSLTSTNLQIILYVVVADLIASKASGRVAAHHHDETRLVPATAALRVGWAPRRSSSATGPRAVAPKGVPSVRL